MASVRTSILRETSTPTRPPTRSTRYTLVREEPNSGQTELKPAYPQGFSDEPAVDPGTCVTGWLAFDASAPLQQLRYSNSDGDVLIWNLPN